MEKITNTFAVQGMHCASCAVIIERSLSKLSGIHSVSVNMASEKAMIEYEDTVVSVADMNQAIGKLGYSIRLEETLEAGEEANQTAPQVTNNNHDVAYTQAKMLFVLPLALFVFFIMLWEILARVISSIPNLPIPMESFELVTLVTATIVMFWIGQPFLVGIGRFLKYRVANMDTLIGIGTLTAYLYSAVIVLVPAVRDYYRLPDYTYFDVVIVVIGFVTLGKFLEARSKAKTGEAIKKLIGLQAKTALVIREGKEVELAISEVVVGDHLIVKPGGKIPVDGVIVKGVTAIDESMISGESIPVDKVAGDTVIGATLNKQGSIEYEATRVGKDTMLSEIIRLVERAQGSRAPVQALVDRLSSVFVPVVLVIAFLTLLSWMLIGPQFVGQSVAITYGILSFVGILVIACPCALGLATPTAIIVGVGKGASRGILVKDAKALESLARADTVVMDKTGTLTRGKPAVTNVITTNGFSEDELLALAASIENRSEHPLAEAIVEYGRERGVVLGEVDGFVAEAGVGVSGTVLGKRVRVKKPDAKDEVVVHALEMEGKTVVGVFVDDMPGGYIALADTIKDGAKEAVAKLKASGIDVILLSGDNERVATYIGKIAGINTVIASVLPDEKANRVAALKAEGRTVAMVGDGVNDAPALMTAQIGIAMATGTDIALESAGITILHGDVAKVADAVILARRTMRTIKQNLFWAFIYNLVGIPIAAGVLYPVWGIILNPIFAGLAMAFSSVSVVMNALRLKLVS